MDGKQSVDSLTPSRLLDISQRVISLILETHEFWSLLVNDDLCEEDALYHVNTLAAYSREIDWGLFHWFARGYVAFWGAADPLKADSAPSYHNKAFEDADGLLSAILTRMAQTPSQAQWMTVPAAIDSIDIERARQIAESRREDLVDIISLEWPLRREAAQAANLLSAELQSGIDIKPAERNGHNANDGQGTTYLISELLKDFGDISAPTLNKYIAVAGVRKTRIGERDRRFTESERIAIAKVFAHNGPSVSAAKAKQILVEIESNSKAQN